MEKGRNKKKYFKEIVLEKNTPTPISFHTQNGLERIKDLNSNPMASPPLPLTAGSGLNDTGPSNPGKPDTPRVTRGRTWGTRV